MRGAVTVRIGHRRAQHQRARRRIERGAVVRVGRVAVVDRRQLVQRHVSRRRVERDREVVRAAHAAGDHVAHLVEHDLRPLRTTHPQRVQPRVDVGPAQHQAVAGHPRPVRPVADGGAEVVGEVGRGVDRQVRFVHRQAVGHSHAGRADARAVILDRDSEAGLVDRVHAIRNSYLQVQAGGILAIRAQALQQMADRPGQDHFVGNGAARSTHCRGPAIERHPDDLATGIRADQNRLAAAISPGQVGGTQQRRARIDQLDRQRRRAIAGDGQAAARVGGGIRAVAVGTGAQTIRNACRQAFFGDPGLRILHARNEVIIDDRARGLVRRRTDVGARGRRDSRHHRLVGLVETVDHRIRDEAHAQLPCWYGYLARRARAQSCDRVVRVLGRRPAQRDRHHRVRHRHPIQADLISQVDRTVLGHARRRHRDRHHRDVIVDDVRGHAASPDHAADHIAQVDRVFLAAFDQGVVQRHHRQLDRPLHRRREGQGLRQRVVVHPWRRVGHQGRARPGRHLHAELLVIGQGTPLQADRVAGRRPLGNGRVADQIDRQLVGIEDGRVDIAGGRIDFEAFEIAARDGFDPDVVELAALDQVIDQGLDREALAGLTRRYRHRSDPGEIDAILRDPAVLEGHDHVRLPRALQGHGVGSGEIALAHRIRPDDADLGQVLVVDHGDGGRLVDAELVIATAIGTRDADVDDFATLDIGIIRADRQLHQSAAPADRDGDALPVAQVDDQIAAAGWAVDGRVQADPGAFDHIGAIEEDQPAIAQQRLTAVVELDIAQGEQGPTGRGAQGHIFDRDRGPQRVFVGQRLDPFDDAQQAHEAAATATAVAGRQASRRRLEGRQEIFPELQRLQHGGRGRRLHRCLLRSGRGRGLRQAVVHAHALLGGDGQQLAVRHLQLDTRSGQRGQDLAVLDHVTDLEGTRLAIETHRDDISGDGDYFCDLGHFDSPVEL